MMNTRLSAWMYLTATSIICGFFTVVAQLPSGAFADEVYRDATARKASPVIPHSCCNLVECGQVAECPQGIWAEMAWQTFIPLNWPQATDQDAVPGQPLGWNATDRNNGWWQEQNANFIFGTFNSNYTDPDHYPDTVWWSYNNKFQLINSLGTTVESVPSASNLNCGTWADPFRKKPTLEFEGKEYEVLGAFSKAASPEMRLDELFDDAFVHAPLIDRYGKPVLYQIFVNQAYWEWIFHSGYFDAQRQAIDVNNSNQSCFKFMPLGVPNGDYKDLSGCAFLPGYPGSGDVPPFPEYAALGAISIKVAWRQLNQNDDPARYYTRQIYYQNNNETVCSGEDGGPITVGLVGMHIFRAVPKSGPYINDRNGRSVGFWMTFEHVDNVNGNASVGSVASFNLNCSPAASGFTRHGTCQDAVADIFNDNTSQDYPPPRMDVAENYPQGLCDPLDSMMSQVFRIAESEANLEQNLMQSVNLKYQSLLGDPFRNYQLVNTLQSSDGTLEKPEGFVPPFNPPFQNSQDGFIVGSGSRYLTNTSLEPYSQYNFNLNGTGLAPVTDLTNRQAMSCINCHAAASSAPGAKNLLPNPADPSWAKLPDVDSGYRQLQTFLLSQAGNSKPADINLDTRVDVEDLIRWIDAFGSCVPTQLAGSGRYCEADVDRDGRVNVDDLLLVLGSWGS